jgi:hypothetical protein
MSIWWVELKNSRVSLPILGALTPHPALAAYITRTIVRKQLLLASQQWPVKFWASAVAYFSTTVGNLSLQITKPKVCFIKTDTLYISYHQIKCILMKQALSYKQNYEFRTLLFQVIIVESCEKQSKLKHREIYRL